LLSCLLLTYSRGAWAGLFIGSLMAGCYLIWRMPLKIRILTLFILVSLILALVIILPHIRSEISFIGGFKVRSGEMLKNRVRLIGYSWDVRMQLWKEALCVIRDHPLWGAGLNTYALVIRPYKSFYFGEAYAHNSFLQMAAETGVLGLLSFLWILFGYFKNGFRHLSNSRNSLVLGLMSGVLAFLAQSFVDTNLYALQLVVLFWFMLGLTFAVINIEQKYQSFNK